MKKYRRKARRQGKMSALVLGLLLPLLITVLFQNRQLDILLGGVETAAGQDADCVPEEVLIGMLAKEISVNAEEEVLRAQCVIARTNYLDAKKKGTREPDRMSLQEMQDIFGEDYEAVYETFRQCVKDTAGEVLLWQGDYIYAAYHAISSGTTRTMQELYGQVPMPYLTGCDCHDDAAAEGYLSVYYWEKTEFLQKVKAAFQDAVIDDAAQVQVKTRDTAGYALTVTVGDTEYEGETFRKAMQLNSACLTIAETGDKIRIVSQGVGHGFGMSQHMAGVLAGEGKDHFEILNYFYPGAELTQKE